MTKTDLTTTTEPSATQPSCTTSQAQGAASDPLGTLSGSPTLGRVPDHEVADTSQSVSYSSIAGSGTREDLRLVRAVMFYNSKVGFFPPSPPPSHRGEPEKC